MRVTPSVSVPERTDDQISRVAGESAPVSKTHHPEPSRTLYKRLKGVSKTPRLVIWLMESSLRQILSPNNHIQPDHLDR
jgi:hypothetical protein